jgi:hypothetical protein
MLSTSLNTLNAHVRRAPIEVLAAAQSVADFITEHDRRPARGGAADEAALAEQMHTLRAMHPVIAQRFGFTHTDKPRPPKVTYAEKTAKALEKAQAVLAFITKHKRLPRRSRTKAGTEEYKLASQLKGIRVNHPLVTEENGLTPDALSKALQAPVTNTVLANARAVQAFVAERGFVPSRTASEPNERRLANAMKDVRCLYPALAKEYGFATGDAPVRGSINGRVYKRMTFADRLIAHVREAARPVGNTFHEALVSEPLACQVTTPARMRAELERDCWWFTLEGQTTPDPRTWHELRVSGDYAAIVGATRVAYLDFAAQAVVAGPLKRAPRRLY